MGSEVARYHKRSWNKAIEQEKAREVTVKHETMCKVRNPPFITRYNVINNWPLNYHGRLLVTSLILGVKFPEMLSLTASDSNLAKNVQFKPEEKF